MATNKHVVAVYYPGGIDSDLDQELFRIVGRPSDASGCRLVGDRERDHAWYFDQYEDAYRCYAGLLSGPYKERRELEISVALNQDGPPTR